MCEFFLWTDVGEFYMSEYFIMCEFCKANKVG